MHSAVLTISDGAAAGIREDVSGAILAEFLASFGEVARAIVPDDIDAIATRLTLWAEEGLDCIVTTGGTGVGPRDVTPEATATVLERPLPGIAEALRQASLAHTPFGMLSRGLAGARGATLIINLPGSPKACRELWPVVAPVIPHAVDLLHGKTRHENR